MKKILLFLLLLTFFAIATCYSFSVFADFDQTYQDYLYLQDGYRLSLTNFQTAKNRYLTYKTLTSQTEALAATKTFLETRDQVSITYLSLLLDKNPGDLSSKLINEEVGFFSSHRVKISAVGSLEDAVKSSDSVKEHFPRTETIARQAVTTILIKKINELKERQIVLESEFEEKVNILRGEGKDTSTLERWLLSTKNKRQMVEDKLNQAQDSSDKLSSRNLRSLSEEFEKIRILIFEANQYLKEATGFLKEIKEELKYGKY